MRIKRWRPGHIAGYFLAVLIVIVIAWLVIDYVAEKQRLNNAADYNRWIFKTIGNRCLGIWNFEEKEGDEVVDLCEATKNSVLHDVYRTRGAVGGRALKLGGDGYVALRTYFDSPQLKRFSACTWLKTGVSCRGYKCNGSLIDFDGDRFFSLYVNGDGRLGFVSYSEKNGVNDLYSSAQVNDNKWHLACAVYDGLDKKIYVDGELDNIQNNAHERGLIGSNSTRYGFLGVSSFAQEFDGKHGDSYYKGMIDDVRIFKEAIPLTAVSGPSLASNY